MNTTLKYQLVESLRELAEEMGFLPPEAFNDAAHQQRITEMQYRAAAALERAAKPEPDTDGVVAALRMVERNYRGQQDHGGSDPKSVEMRTVRAALAKLVQS